LAGDGFEVKKCFCAVGGNFKIIRCQFHSDLKMIERALGDLLRFYFVMQHGLELEHAQGGRIIVPI